MLTKAAQEAAPLEIRIYEAKLRAIYHYPAQLVFIDKISKDGRHANYARWQKGTGHRSDDNSNSNSIIDFTRFVNGELETSHLYVHFWAHNSI